MGIWTGTRTAVIALGRLPCHIKLGRYRYRGRVSVFVDGSTEAMRR